MQVGEHEANTPEGILDAFVDALWATGPQMSEVLIVLCPEHMAYVKDAGWTKSRVWRVSLRCYATPGLALVASRGEVRQWRGRPGSQRP